MGQDPAKAFRHRKFTSRDGRIAAAIHAAGIAALGLSVAIIAGLGLPEETGNPILGVGLATGIVAVLWSLVLSWRGFRHGGRLSTAIWISWLALTETAWALALLWFGEIHGWHSLGTTAPFAIAFGLGLPVWLFAGWVCASIALPCAWWWMRRAERSGAKRPGPPTGETVRREAGPFVWRASLVYCLAVLLVWPVALVLHTVSSLWRVTMPPSAVRHMPKYAQRAGLLLYHCVTGQEELDADLVYEGYLCDGVLVSELERPFGWRGQLCRAMARRHSEGLLSWTREAILSGSGKRSSIEEALGAIASEYPAETARSFLLWMLGNVEARPWVNDFLKGLQGQHDAVRALLPTIVALKTAPDVDARNLLALISDASTTDERVRLWTSEYNAATPQQQTMVLQALQYVTAPQGVETFIVEMLDDAQPAIRRQTAQACCDNWWLWRPDMTLPASVMSKFIALTGDGDMAVRRMATYFLAMKTGRSDGISALPGWWNSKATETPAELADRAKVVKAAEDAVVGP